MESFDTNDLIERYLDGSLSPDEKKSVEARMASDPAFRAEVDLHRELHAAFADPKKLQLRDIMSDILRETPAPSEIAQPNWLKILGIALVLLLGAWGTWRIFLPTQENTPAAPAQQENQTPLNSPSNNPDTPSILPSARPSEPIAKADKAAFKSNPAFEARLGNGGIRSTNEAVQMQNPSMGADFTASKGMVSIHFKGTALADDDQSENPLQLNIYASKSAGSPLAQVLLGITNRNEQAEKWTFSSKRSFRLPPGLYYYTVERQTDSDLIFVGKFTVDKKTSEGF